MRINSLLQNQFEPNGLLEKSASVQNIKMNGVLLDFRFTPNSTYIAGNATQSPYRVLKNIVLNVNLRTGSGNGKNALLVDRVPLFLLLEHSDFVGGVDATLTEMQAGKEWRCSGYLDIGYFEVGDNDSLDIQLYCKNNPEISSKVYLSSDLRHIQDVNVKTYSCTAPTGSSQTFDNVLQAFITTDTELNDTISTTDQMNNEVINIESCIALSNAVGRFEKFKRYGQFYEDVYGLGQTLTMSVPTTNADTQILLVKYDFNLNLQVNGTADFKTSRRALLTQIASKQPDKFRFLRNLGIDTQGVMLVSE